MTVLIEIFQSSWRSRWSFVVGCRISFYFRRLYRVDPAKLPIIFSAQEACCCFWEFLNSRGQTKSTSFRNLMVDMFATVFKSTYLSRAERKRKDLRSARSPCLLCTPLCHAGVSLRSFVYVSTSLLVGGSCCAGKYFIPGPPFYWLGGGAGHPLRTPCGLNT